MRKLYTDQEGAIQGVRTSFARSNRRTLLVAPCGFGKTACFSYVASGVNQARKRVTILAHRSELLEQISDELKLWNVPHGMLLGGMIGLPRSNIVVASVQTLARRLKHYPAPDLIVVDEAHHCSVDSQYDHIISAFPSARVLGVTATPCRLDGRGLGEMFDDMVVGPSVAELIALGRLSPFEVYAPSSPDLSGVHRRAGDYVKSGLEQVMDKPKITGNAVEYYKKLAYGKRGVAFCVSVKHAMDVAEEFRNAGFRASHVEGRMKDDERARIIEKFRVGDLDILTSADLISEGFNVPNIEVAIGLRPTQSLSLFIQQNGRALRLAPGKTKAIIIDHAGNTLRHGFIDDHREWTLDGADEKRAKGEAVPRIQTCPACFAVHKPAPVCVKCGHVYQTKGRIVEHVDGELVQVARADDYSAATGQSEYERLYYILRNVAKRNGNPRPDEWAFRVASSKLAQARAKERGHADGTVNGLLPEEIQEFRDRTIDRERIMRAMSKEDAIAPDAQVQ